MNTWVEDGDGNKCSVEYFGSREVAERALASLKNCKNCTNCSDCSGCSGCSDCSGCSVCSRCRNIAWLDNKTNLVADQALASPLAPLGPPPVPTIEGIHQKVFEAASQPKALAMDTWHTCATTHCRAGWVVRLAGDAGYALEQFYNPLLAAMMIYDASDPNYRINPGRFFDANDIALADMKKLAETPAAT